MFQTGRRLNALQWSVANIEANITKLGHQLDILQHNQELTIATLAEVQASQAAEDAQIKALITAAQTTQAALVSASAQIAALQAQIAAGSSVTSADLDSLKADMDAQAAAMGAVLAPASPSGATGGATGATGA